MNDLWFWQAWRAPYRYATVTLLGLGMAIMLLFFGLYLFDVIPSLGWNVLSKGEWMPSPLSLLQLDTHTTGLPKDFFVLQQAYRGNPLELDVAWGNGLMVMSALLFTIGLALITTLPRIWYLGGITATILLLYLFKLDLLEIPLFGLNGGLTIALALYLPLSFYLHEIRPQTSVLARIGLFSIATVLFAVLIEMLATPSEPYFFLSQYTILLPLALIMLFIATVSHEPIANMVFLASQSGGRQSVFHFIVFSLIYLAYLFVSYSHLVSNMDWDIYYFDAFLLLGASSLLGIWGFRKRADMAANIMPFAPVGAWAFALMMMATWGGILYFWITANDSMLRTIQEIIYMGHMGFGFVFFLYSLSNFYTLMRLGKPVYRVLYKPTRMPFYVFRFMGIIATIAVGYQSTQFTVPRATSGYFNGLGDAYAIEEDYTLAQAYYLEGRLYSNTNDHSNYALASLAIKNKKTEIAIQHLSLGAQQDPLPQTHVNLSLLLKDIGKFFDAKFQLEDGRIDFPNSAQIANNLGLMYHDIESWDSAAYFFQMAEELSSGPGATNAWSIAVELGIRQEVDSVLELLYQGNPGRDVNILAWLGQQDLQSISLPAPPPWPQDSVLSQNEFGQLYNYALLRLQDPDTAWMNQLHAYTQHPANDGLWERLTLAKVYSDLAALDVAAAFRGLGRLSVNLPKKTGYYETFQGVLSLQLGLPEKAIQHLVAARRESYPLARPHLGFAYLEAGVLSEARSYWQEIATTLGPDHPDGELATLVMGSLNWQRTAATSLSDVQAHWLLRYRQRELDASTLLGVWNSITDPTQKALAGMALLNAGGPIAEAMARELSGLPVPSQEMAQRIAWTLQAETANTDTARLLAATPITLDQKIAKRNMLAMQKGAEAQYYWAMAAPFDGATVVSATNALMAQGDTVNGYAVALEGMLYNPWSIEIATNYVRQCARSGYFTLANSALEELAPQISEVAYRSLAEDIAQVEETLTPEEFRN